MERIFQEHNLFIDEDGPVWRVSVSPSYGWTHVAMFVLGLVSFITGVNAMVGLASGMPLAMWGSMFLAFVLGAGGAYRLRVYQQAMAEAAEAEAVVLCTIDWDQGEVRVQGGSVVSLDRCRFLQTTQMTSSAPALVLDAGGHRLMLLAGNPFGISIHGLVALLEEQEVRIEKTWFAF